MYQDDPEQLLQRVVDDKDLLGFALVTPFLVYKGLERCSCDRRNSSVPPDVFPHKEDCDYPAYLRQRHELFHGFSAQIVAELCDCGRTPASHLEDCNYTRASQDMKKTWGPYILRKTREFREARVNR